MSLNPNLEISQISSTSGPENLLSRTAQVVQSKVTPMIQSSTPPESTYLKLLDKLINKTDIGNALGEYTSAFRLAGNLIFEILFNKKTRPLFEHLLSNKMFWTIDLSDEAYDTLIKPIIRQIAKSVLKSEQKNLILATLIQYLHITDKLHSEYKKPDVLSFKSKDSDETLFASFAALVSEVRRKFPTLCKGDLDANKCHEAGCTFIQMKIWEFQILQRTGHWGLACQGQIRHKPIYLIAQDETEVKLLPYKGGFRGDALVALGSIGQTGIEENLREFLDQEFLDRIDLSNDTFNLTTQQLTEFKSKMGKNKKEAPYILLRMQFPLKDEEIRESKRKESSDQANSERQLKRPKTGESSRQMTEDGASESSNQLLLQLKAQEKAKQPSDDTSIESSSSSSSVSVPDNPFTFDSKAYKPLGAMTTSFKKRKGSENSEGDAIVAGAQAKLQSGDEVDLSITDLSQLFEKATEIALTTTMSDAITTEAKFKLYHEKRAFESPLIAKLARVIEPQPANCLPILKPYQKRALATLLGLEQSGMNGLLSMEMGTGKSLVIMAKIMDDIAKGKVGNSIVLLPLSVIGNFEDEALRALYEAKSHAIHSVIQNREVVELMLTSFLNKISDYFKEEPNQPSQSATYQLMFLLRAYALGIQAKTKRPVEYSFFIDAPFKHQPQKLLNLCASHLTFQAVGTRHNLEKRDAIIKKVNEIKASLQDQTLQAVCERLITFFEGDSLILEDVWGEVAKTAVNNPEEILYLVGSLLNLHPDDFEFIDSQKAKNILGFPFEKVIKETDVEKLAGVLQSNQQIVISSHTVGESVDKKGMLFTNIDLLIVDEAQFAHTAGSQAARWLETVGEKLKAKKIPFWLVTATPSENNYQEALQLLLAANPGALLKEHIDAVSGYYERTITQIGKKTACDISSKTDQSWISSNALITSFAQFTALSKILHQTFVNIKKDSPEVAEAWDGQVAKPVYVTINKDLPKDKLELIKQAEKIKRVFEREKATKRTLLGGGILENLQVDSPENQELFTKLATNPDELDNFIQNSPQLEAILNSNEMQEAIQNNKKILLIVSNLIVGKIGMLALKRKFGLADDQVDFYHGDLSLNERDEKVRWFRDQSENGKALFLSIDSGGVGLNLAETEILVDLTFEYNPAKRDQALARAFRVSGGTTLEKVVVRVFFNEVYLEQHQQIIRDLKKLWADFLLNPGLDIDQKFDMYKKILILEVKREALNKTMDVLKANKKAEVASDNLDTLSALISSNQLKEMVARCEITASQGAQEPTQDIVMQSAQKPEPTAPTMKAPTPPKASTPLEYQEELLSAKIMQLNFDRRDLAVNFAAYARAHLTTDRERIIYALKNLNSQEFQELMKLSEQKKLYDSQKYQILEFTRSKDNTTFSANPQQVRDPRKEPLRIETRLVDGKQKFKVLIK